MSDVDNAAVVDIVLRVLGEEKYSLAMRNAETLSRRLGAASARSSKQIVEGQHAAVSSMQASSAALRALHGGFNNNIRAGERFLGMIPGVGKALQAAFPVIGAMALGGAIFEAGKKLHDFIEQVKQMPNVLASGFSQISDSAELSNDKLQITNDKLRDAIAKLEGKPKNGLADAIDVAKDKADELYGKLSKDRSAIEKLLETNTPNWFVQAVSTNAPSSGVNQSIRNYMDDLQGISEKEKNSKTPADHAKYSKQYNDKLNAGIADMTSDIKRRQDQMAKAALLVDTLDPHAGSLRDGHQDQTNNIRAEKKFRDILSTNLDSRNLDKQHADLTAKQNSLEAAKIAAQAQAKAAKQLEAASKEFARTIHHLGIIGHAHAKAKTDLAKGSVSDSQEFLRESRIFPMWVQSRDAQNANSIRQSGYEAQDISAKYTRKLAAAHVDAAVKSGTISPLQADKAYTALDRQQYQDQMTGLIQQLNDIADITNGMTPLGRQAASAKVNNKIGKLSGEYSVANFQDKNAEKMDSAMGKLTSATLQMAQQFTDVGAALASVTQTSLGMANMSIASGVTGQGFHARSLGIGVTQQFVGNALQYGEGSVIKGVSHTALHGHSKLQSMLGMGKIKPSGTHSDPLYVSLVRNQNQPVNSGVSIAQTALGAAAPGKGGTSGKLHSILHAGMNLFNQSNSSGSDVFTSGGQGYSGWLTKAQSVIGGIGSFAGKVMGGFATGGSVAGNVPIVVGEHGREIYTPGPGGGYVTPHHAIASTGGGSTNITNHINAQGAVDPAATAVAVRNAIHASAQQSVRASISQQHEAKMRSPMSSRG